MKTLAKEHQYLQLVRSGPDWTVQFTKGSWRKIGAESFVSENYFDLAGMTMEDKTLFFEAAGVQTVLSPLANNVGTGDSAIIMDIMCTRQITDAQLIATLLYGNMAGNQGVSGSQGPLSFEETVYARTQMFVRHVDTAAWGYLTMTDENFFGSMEPTASDRIYSYRLVFLSALTGGTNTTEVTIAPARHLLKSTAREESDHKYMMRLMRSYQLQQSYDED